MLVLLLIVVTIAFTASLLPILYPGSLVSVLGTPLNVFFAELLGNTFQVGRGTLVTREQGAYALTFEGVVAVYGPALFLILLGLRGK